VHIFDESAARPAADRPAIQGGFILKADGPEIRALAAANDTGS
jgi:hypothetical protein